MRASALATALGLGLAVTSSASAAMAVRMFVAPKTPQAGTLVALYLRTFAPFVDPSQPCGFRLEPWRVLAYPFRVQAVAPDGTAYRVRVAQAKENLYIGHLRLPHEPGLWTIRVLNFFTRYNPNRFDRAAVQCSGALLHFRVRV